LQKSLPSLEISCGLVLTMINQKGLFTWLLGKTFARQKRKEDWEFEILQLSLIGFFWALLGE
jgi:hypothetical protein